MRWVGLTEAEGEEFSALLKKRCSESSQADWDRLVELNKKFLSAVGGERASAEGE